MGFRLARRVVAVSAVGLALGLPACGDQQSRQDVQAEPEGDATHIHGFAATSAGGLLVARHDGLLELAEGNAAPSRVGRDRQDLMGITNASRRRLLASGHPDPGASGMPSDLGIVESRDDGQSWRPIALFGKADFHVLEASGSRIYGFDGRQGALMVNSGGGRWREQVAPDVLVSLAIEPGNPDALMAAGQGALYRSENAGGSWRVRREGTGLLAWPEKRRLFLLDARGQVRRSKDGGTDWDVTGAIGGPPVAFEAIGGALYVALADGTVKRSTDDGASWAVVAS